MDLEAQATTPIDQQYWRMRSCFTLRNLTDDTTVDQFGEGYPRLAAFSSLHAPWQAVRSFARIRLRLIYQKQGEISRLEAQLDELDKIREAGPLGTVLQPDYRTPQLCVMERLEARLCEYGQSIEPLDNYFV
jgi:hypothetical protein